MQVYTELYDLRLEINMLPAKGDKDNKQPRFGKIGALSIACFLVITVTFAVWKLFDVTESSNTAKLSIEKLYKVNIFGTEGEGYVDIEVDENYLENYKKNTGIQFNVSDIELKISRTNNLSNDDRIKVSVTNRDDLKEKGIIFEDSSITYKVSGLKKGIEYDVYKELKIKVDGNDIVLDNSGCSNFVKDNVDFFIKNKKESYKKGDTVIIGAYVDMNAATDNGYIIDKTEKEYIVE